MVCEWCRGTYTSGGTWEPNVNERNDGADLLAWCEHQDWIDVIGLWGTSYLSLTCWTVADITTPKVASICANHYGTDRFASAYQKGSFRCDVLTAWAMQNAGYPVDADYMKSALHLPQMSVDEDMWGGRLDWYRDWISHPKDADAYWDEGFWGLLKSIPSKVKVPMFIHEGWFDHHLGSALTGYAALNEQVKEHSWLRIGCWNHYFLNPLEGLEPKHLDAAEVPAALEWFDLTLKRKQTPMRQVEYYEIGSDSWHVADSWPLPSAGADEVRLYLKSGELTAEAPQAASAAEYDYDPANPVMTRGGEALLTTMDEIGARIQPEPGWRDDVITFESEPLDHDLHIQGAISVDLYVSSSAPDTAFTAKLMCVDPDGTARNYHHHDRAGYAGRRAVQAGRNPPREHRHVGHLLDGARRVAHPLRYLIFRFPAILRTHQPRWTVERTDRHAGGPPDHSHGRRHAVRHRAAGAWLRYGFDND